MRCVVFSLVCRCQSFGRTSCLYFQSKRIVDESILNSEDVGNSFLKHNGMYLLKYWPLNAKIQDFQTVILCSISSVCTKLPCLHFDCRHTSRCEFVTFSNSNIIQQAGQLKTEPRRPASFKVKFPRIIYDVQNNLPQVREGTRNDLP